MLLSILIPTIRGREAMLARLMERLEPQCGKKIEIVTALDSGGCSIGEKRNKLLNAARGDWLAFVDDDDLPSDDYVARISEALKQKPDCVGFKVRRFSDGVQQGEAIHRLSSQSYRTIEKPGKPPLYLRTPNHLNPVRADLAKSVGFLERNYCEDRNYAERLCPLLKTEVFIDAYLYDYLYVAPPRRAHEVTNEIHPAIRLWRQAKVPAGVP